MEKRLLDPPELRDDAIVLERVVEADLPVIAQSFIDEPELGEIMGFEVDPSVEKMSEWVPTRDNGVWLKAVEPDTRRYIGDIAVHHVEWEHDRAELGLYTLASERGRGVGTRMVSLVRDWLFAEGFLRVQMKTLPHNEGIHKIARNAGFEREGLLRSYFVERGRAVDAVLFSDVNKNWVKR